MKVSGRQSNLQTKCTKEIWRLNEAHDFRSCQISFAAISYHKLSCLQQHKFMIFYRSEFQHRLTQLSQGIGITASFSEGSKGASIFLLIKVVGRIRFLAHSTHNSEPVTGPDQSRILLLLSGHTWEKVLSLLRVHMTRLGSPGQFRILSLPQGP